RDFSARQRAVDLLDRAGWRKPFLAIEDDMAELVHGEDRHGVRGGVGKTETPLLVAHLICEGAAAWHDDQRQAGPRQRGRPHAHLLVIGRAAAELDDGCLHRVSPFWPRPASASCVFSGCGTGFGIGFSLARLRSISTPTPPAPSSSFSTRTVTRTTRGSSSTCAATCSASVSLSSTWPRAMMARMPSMMMS